MCFSELSNSLQKWQKPLKNIILKWFFHCLQAPKAIIQKFLQNKIEI